MDYICTICNKTGTRKDVPYRIIYNPEDRCKYIGQLCEECYRKCILENKKNNGK